METLCDSHNHDSKAHEEKIKATSLKLSEQMHSANATHRHVSLETVLAFAFEADGNSIEYLTTFHSLLGMALHHTQMYSEDVNVEIAHNRLLKRALIDH